MLGNGMAHIGPDFSAELPKTLIILTGASRGIGKGIVLELATNAKKLEPMEFLVTSTKVVDLEIVSQELKQFPGVSHVNYNAFDMSDLCTLQANITTLLAMATQPQYDRIIVIINHGSLGPINLLSKIVDNIDDIIKTVNTNITSVLVFSSVVLKELNERSKILDIINISSIAATEVFTGLGLYSIGKSARDMIMKIIEKEFEYNSKSQVVRTLSYSPGPVETEMYKELITNNPIEEQRNAFKKLYTNGGLVPIEKTCAKLVEILLKEKWSNGAHIDFFQ